MVNLSNATALACFHCGETCTDRDIESLGKHFCCQGCKMVFEILEEHKLSTYYDLNGKPGTNRRILPRKDKYAFLDDPAIASKLIRFSEGSQSKIILSLPQIHCSSCLYLLENLTKLNAGIIQCRINFEMREAQIMFDHETISLRKVVELLESIGYEPALNLHNLGDHKPGADRGLIYQLGTAGFCFANIMLLSFPEYLGLNDSQLLFAFRWLNFILAIPVLLFSAQPFFKSGWTSLRSGFLNIDAPIAFAILITFSRSAFEVIAGTGGGYFDSMSGIVFFMLAGRVLQNRTFRQLSFERDFSAYFPIAASILKDGKEVPVALPDLHPGYTAVIHHGELIPTDGIVSSGEAMIDYSFVSGESAMIPKEVGELVYAGGRQRGGAIEVLILKEVAQGYLTSLWTKQELKTEKAKKNRSFIHFLSQRFTWFVIFFAASAGIYWSFHNPGLVWNSITAVLIVACPCALLLSNSFTNGSILKILGRQKFYLRNAEVIEDIAACTHIVFDKTGTLTETNGDKIGFVGMPLSPAQRLAVASLASQSRHPLSGSITRFLKIPSTVLVRHFKEFPGKGIEGVIFNQKFALGSGTWLGKKEQSEEGQVWLKIDDQFIGYFRVQFRYRSGALELLKSLGEKFAVSILSGDNEGEKNHLADQLGPKVSLLFKQSPFDKLDYIGKLQSRGERVLMIGDGLNDAGALRQSDVGIAVADNTNNFTPACDVIMDAGHLNRLFDYIRLCKANRSIVLSSFVFSILYNLVGLFFAMRGVLSPMVAAILMPASSFTILMISFGSSSFCSMKWKLNSAKNHKST